ncbi:hypothetical protein KL930_000130 [Ogataea haglerorum]|nr:hypothetical protein KL951_002389 [Ogataea haglerorum]KAG7706635.1 hypothetical protein KL950_003300 [Ogataea haglerorum]KAG7717762.1 hypothetical protein KL913_002698 [Ogataea haglerorum]KAG7718064.1 hypothetical protein KL949_003036 [Ogataea haglerorum]KAG7750594.1 hypothetical protein KL912_001154 [Ogataea haglerorum]
MSALNSSTQHQETFSDLPLGTLPPRKRAKTEEEKEQRRVERILRNRRAAHASREKKRRHVEYLENYVTDLESALATHEGNYRKMAKIQSGLISLLSEHGIDYSSVDLAVEPCPKVERPEGLELTGSIPVKKQKVASAKTPKSLKKSKSEIPSPSFDEEMFSEEENENDDCIEEYEKSGQEATMAPSLTHNRKRKAQDAYISPPGSTSPSKLKLEEDERISKQEYSNLFDDTEDIFPSEKSSSLELYKQDDLTMASFVKQEGEEMVPFVKQEDELKFPDTGFNADDCHLIQVEDLCSFNSVHHPAVMVVKL